MTIPLLKIGTRGSPLALAQAHEVRDRLVRAGQVQDGGSEIVVIKTSGDRIQDRPLSEVGGKGLFTKEIEDALIAGEIDLAVHSMKDMPTVLPPGLEISCVLAREDVRDAWLSPHAPSLERLAAGSIVGTSSLRRQAQIRRLRPDLEVITYRGNVQTRLRKLEEGVADATLLACAGLRRLGMEHLMTAPIDVAQMLPAVAQGAIGIEIRAHDDRVRRLLEPLNHRPTQTELAAERTFLAGLDGSCRTPIAGLARLDGDRLTFHGELLSPDGVHHFSVQIEGAAGDARAMGAEAARKLRADAGDGFIRALLGGL